jgi:hypothetical protein
VRGSEQENDQRAAVNRGEHIRWRWILQWLGITFVVMIVIFLAIV